MCLVDHDQPGSCQQPRQTLREAGVAEPFGRDQQHVEAVAGDRVEDHIPVGDVGRVDRRSAQPALGCRGHLVAHQREQRRHDQRRPLACRTQCRGRAPIDGGLAPAGGLHDEHPRLLLDQRCHRGGLVVARARVRPRHRGEDLAQVGVGDSHRRDHQAFASVPVRGDCRARPVKAWAS